MAGREVFPIINCRDLPAMKAFYEAALDGLLGGVAELGGSVAVPATETPWGERVAYVRDPEGTMLLVIQDA